MNFYELKVKQFAKPIILGDKFKLFNRWSNNLFPGSFVFPIVYAYCTRDEVSNVIWHSPYNIGADAAHICRCDISDIVGIRY